MTQSIPPARWHLSLALAALSPWAWAQAVPDAGQLLRDQTPRPDLAIPVVPRLALPAPAASPPPAAGGLRFRVDTVVLQGHTVFSTDTLLLLVADLPGEWRTLADAEAAARRITAHYRAKGFPVARAVVPAQDVTDGHLRIQVLEGRIDRVVLDNRSRLNEAAVALDRDGLRSGDSITSEPIDRALQVWLDTPGVGGARATLQPGDAVGSSRLDIALDPAPLVQGRVVLDNHGNASTGRSRLTGQLQIDSPFGQGERFTLAGLSSGPGLRHGRAGVDLPLGAAGTRLGLERHHTRYRLGGAFAYLKASGRAAGTHAELTHPLRLASVCRAQASLSAGHQSLTDRIDATGELDEKSLRKLGIGWAGSWCGPAGQVLSTADLRLTTGRLRIHGAANAAQDAASARTQGRYVRLVWDLTHLHTVSTAAQVHLAYAGQRSSRNLDSAEKFGIGGPNGVRAFATGEASGDHADQLRIEWRQRFSPALQGLVFHDFGRVRINHSRFDPSAANHRTLSGAGIGLNADAHVAGSALSLRGTVAWPLQGGPATDATTHRPALWLTLAARF